MTQKYGESELRALFDLGSEAAASMSDVEIRQRAKEEGLDLHSQGNRFREAVAAHAKTVKLSRLHDARKRMTEQPAPDASIETGHEQPFLPLSIVLSRLSELVGMGIADPNSKLTLAYRNASADLSEDDLRSLLHDYEELLRNESQDARK